MQEKYYIMPTARYCYGTERAGSREEALSQFIDGIHGDFGRLVTADKTFIKTKGIRGYYPPHNEFEIFMNCVTESLKAKPNRLYCMNGPVHEMSAAGEKTVEEYIKELDEKYRQ